MLLTAADIGGQLNVQPRLVSRAIARGWLKSTLPPGGEPRVFPSDFKAWAEQGYKGLELEPLLGLADFLSTPGDGYIAGSVLGFLKDALDSRLPSQSQMQQWAESAPDRTTRPMELSGLDSGMRTRLLSPAQIPVMRGESAPLVIDAWGRSELRHAVEMVVRYRTDLPGGTLFDRVFGGGPGRFQSIVDEAFQAVQQGRIEASKSYKVVGRDGTEKFVTAELEMPVSAVWRERSKSAWVDIAL